MKEGFRTDEMVPNPRKLMVKKHTLLYLSIVLVKKNCIIFTNMESK